MTTDIDFIQISENDKEFAKAFERFVNGRMASANKTGKALATMHRYLQQEAFKVCLAYIRQLALNHHKGWFDDRNEWAARISAEIYDYLTREELLYDKAYIERKD